MKLYQHSAQCPVAMQIFFDANPQYWSFVPMTIDESQQSELQSIEHSIEFSDQLDWNVRSKEDCRRYVEVVPKPPTAYTFYQSTNSLTKHNIFIRSEMKIYRMKVLIYMMLRPLLFVSDSI